MDFGGRPIADGIRTRNQATHIASLFAVCQKVGVNTPSRVAPQEIHPVPADHFWDRIFVFRPT